MTKEEFENLTEVETTQEQYNMIDMVYTHFDRWNSSKKQFVKWFKKNGMLEVVKLYNVFLEAEQIVKTYTDAAEKWWKVEFYRDNFGYMH